MPTGAGNPQRDGDLIKVLDESINVNESVRLFLRRALESERLSTPSIELFRHFFARLFDSEFVSSPGQLKVILGGVIGILASLGGILAQVYYHKYLVLHQLDSPDPYRRALLADILFLETLVMVILGLFTAVQWPALYPTLRDYLALAALPIRMRQIFLAKFASLAALAGGILLTITAAPSFILPAVIKGHYEQGTFFHIPALFVSATLAGAFVFFSLIALQGILLNFTPVRHFGKVSLTVQGLLVAALVGGLPFVLSLPNLHPYMDLRPAWAMWAPPVWFVAIHQLMMGVRDPITAELARRAWIASASSVAAAVAAYWWSYKSHRRRVLESPGGESSGGALWLETLQERLVPQPRHLAVFSFIAKTLRRSQQHRLILTGFASLALALIVEGFLGASQGTRSGFRAPSVAIPLALSLFLLAGLRYLFRLPVELRANWVFRIGSEGHGAELLRGVEAFLYCTALAPLALMSAAVEIALLGPSVGLAAAIIASLASLILVEMVLFSFPRIPFTSSYLPGRRPLVDVLIGYVLASVVYVSVLASLIASCAETAGRTTGLAAILLAAWYGLRHARRTSYEIHRLEFEELPETIVETLSIEND
jgi:hypothetical protein